jgi:hypothetical protein
LAIASLKGLKKRRFLDAEQKWSFRILWRYIGANQFFDISKERAMLRAASIFWVGVFQICLPAPGVLFPLFVVTFRTASTFAQHERPEGMQPLALFHFCSKAAWRSWLAAASRFFRILPVYG